MSPTSPPITSETRVRVPPSVYARVFGAELVLLDFGRGEYFGLDEVGAEIWARLEAGDLLPAIADRLVQQYDVSWDDALRDIIELVREMRERCLIETAC